MKITITKNLLSGLVFAAIGIAALVIAQGYRLGVAMRMGPGYFPTMTGAGLLLIGVILAGRSLLYPGSSEIVARWELRPVVFIIAGVLAFGALIDTAGLIAAIVVMLVLARFAGRPGSLLDFAAMVVVMCALAVGIFVYGLEIPLRLWPW